MKLNITNDVTSADLEQLRKNLISYNVPHFEPVDEKPLGIFYDDDAGVRRAGLTGKLFGNWLLIDLLWVEDSLRGKGVGSSLLQAAEDAARDYGAKRVFLNTFRFQAPDFYLKHGFDKEYSDYGCPYVQEDCDVQKPSDNLVIYGHHMSNGSMFAHLEKYKDEGFWSEHRAITFNTLTDKQEYEIVAVFRTVVYTDSPEAFKFYRFIDAESANAFDDFIAKSKELSFYDTGVTAEYGDKLITLSTCEYSRNNSRLVVVAKRITEDGGADAAKTHAEATAEGERPN